MLTLAMKAHGLRTTKWVNMFYFAGLANKFAEYTDFDINTDNPNEYWVLSYDEDRHHWYAIQRIAKDDEAPFDEGRAATRIEISQMLATMPVNQLPANALLGG